MRDPDPYKTDRDAMAVTTVPASRYRPSVLVVDDEPTILSLLVHQLGPEFEIFTACSSAQARSQLSAHPIDIIITDLNLPDGSGLAFLEWARQIHPRVARVLLSGTARLTDAVDAINRCQIHRLVLKPWRLDDLLITMRAVSRMIQLERSHEKLLEEYRGLLLDLEHRVTDRTRELEQKNQLLEKMALTDALTGVPNRRAVELIARKELLRRARINEPLALGLIDADHFKDINSAYLLVGGDHVLTWLGQTLQNTLRGTDAIGRIGGEEFMIVAPSTDMVGAHTLAERLRSTVERERTQFKGTSIGITISLGFAVVEADMMMSFDELRSAAAAALSDAKTQGRNRAIIRRLSAEAVPIG
ncbi:GGDEF domain-containing response regulator [Limnoglobus roseus]|uniref:diguanylate cyclase n=1 Tax=Limnoglobus roseus TaxID=2598579 RepID=A0A5C1ASF3_9BACT|nr:diguanylate cyclase [Limnoglobus roseus]QEL20164.1 putative diguanylate cyclase [Limnoglobus roseus]